MPKGKTTTTSTKYHLGNVLEFTTEAGATKHGKVVGVLTEAQGNYYKLENEETFVPEVSINAAYIKKPVGNVGGRKPKTTTDQATNHVA